MSVSRPHRNVSCAPQEVDDWLEEYRTKFTEMSGMKKLAEASEGASCCHKRCGYALNVCKQNSCCNKPCDQVIIGDRMECVISGGRTPFSVLAH